MIRIGLLSDTHAYLDPKVFEYFKDCDEVWHAGDIGSIDVLNQLDEFKKTRAVFGNIDGIEVRMASAEIQLFEVEQFRILVIHIAGPFSRYNSLVQQLIKNHRPNILVCGHSHILKIAHDPKFNLLYMNPGACGKSGFHKVKTILRFILDGKEIQNMEVIELHDP